MQRPRGYVSVADRLKNVAALSSVVSIANVVADKVPRPRMMTMKTGGSRSGTASGGRPTSRASVGASPGTVGLLARNMFRLPLSITATTYGGSRPRPPLALRSQAQPSYPVRQQSLLNAVSRPANSSAFGLIMQKRHSTLSISLLFPFLNDSSNCCPCLCHLSSFVPEALTLAVLPATVADLAAGLSAKQALIWCSMAISAYT